MIWTEKDTLRKKTRIFQKNLKFFEKAAKMI